MKTCSNCGKSVSLASQVGNKCPHCGLTWSFERNTQSNYSKSSHLKSVSIVILIVCIATAMVLPLVLRSKLPKNEIDKDRIIAQMTKHWELGINDSLKLSRDIWFNQNGEDRDYTLNKTQENYCNTIEMSKGEEKIRLIKQLTSIDEIFRSTFPPFKFNWLICNKLKEIESNTDIIPAIRDAARETLQKIE